MGQAPLTWTDIKDWAYITQRKLTPWEAGALQELSSTYLHELQAAKDPFRPKPIGKHVKMTKEDIVENRERVSNQIKKLGKLAKKG